MRFFIAIPLLLVTIVGAAAEPFRLPRCQIVPLAEHQVSLRIDGWEKTRWHFGGEYPRPFFFPFLGPSGTSLTRMGHPGAPNHDHHRSVWFAHALVNGETFWSDQARTQIRQKTWSCYADGDEEAIMATVLGWYDAEDSELMEQEVVAALRPVGPSEHALEIQITLRPATDAGQVELGQTNFGFLGVRVAKSLSVHFGGGQLNNSEGDQGEANIFGKRARWVDYSGPVAVGRGPSRKTAWEGVTYFDHPGNSRYPTYWHVREDGWMGASFCLRHGLTVRAAKPLTLRYLLHAHQGGYSADKAQAVQAEFASRRGFTVRKSRQRHHQFEVQRQSN